jgi:hypothetical protein
VPSSPVGEAPWVDNELVSRDEVVALLFNVSDIAASLRVTERLLGETMAKRKLTQADRERLERMTANADWLRELAEKGLADLEQRRGGPIRRPGQTNAEWLRELAEKGKRDLEARGQAD